MTCGGWGSLPRPSTESHIGLPANKGTCSGCHREQHTLIGRAWTSNVDDSTATIREKRKMAALGTPIGRLGRRALRSQTAAADGGQGPGPAVRRSGFGCRSEHPCTHVKDRGPPDAFSQPQPISLRGINEDSKFGSQAPGEHWRIYSPAEPQRIDRARLSVL